MKLTLPTNLLCLNWTRPYPRDSPSKSTRRSPHFTLAFAHDSRKFTDRTERTRAVPTARLANADERTSYVMHGLNRPAPTHVASLRCTALLRGAKVPGTPARRGITLAVGCCVQHGRTCDMTTSKPARPLSAGGAHSQSEHGHQLLGRRHAQVGRRELLRRRLAVRHDRNRVRAAGRAACGVACEGPPASPRRLAFTCTERARSTTRQRRARVE